MNVIDYENIKNCDKCKKKPCCEEIYNCITCEDFNFEYCKDCYKNNHHDHLIKLIKNRKVTGKDFEKLKNNVENLKERMENMIKELEKEEKVNNNK